MTEAAEGGETQTGGGETTGGYDYKKLHNFPLINLCSSIDEGQYASLFAFTLLLLRFRSVLYIYIFI